MVADDGRRHHFAVDGHTHTDALHSTEIELLPVSFVVNLLEYIQGLCKLRFGEALTIIVNIYAWI